MMIVNIHLKTKAQTYATAAVVEQENRGKSSY